MSESSLFYGPIFYNISWTLIGLGFLLLGIGIIVAIFYFTRRKKVRTLSTLKVEQPEVIDLNELKKKYIGLIDQAERNYNNHISTLYNVYLV